MGRVRWHTLLIAALTVALLWLFVASFDLRKAWVEITRADLRFIAAGLAMLFLTYVIRTVRWMVLLERRWAERYGG